MIQIIFILISDPLCPMDGGGSVLNDETIPVRIQMFNHGMELTTQNKFVLISCDPFL